MTSLTLQLPRLIVLTLVLGTGAGWAQEKKAAEDGPEKEIVLYDEAEKGDFKAVESNKAKTAIRVARPGIFVLKGAGQDAVDDVDAFLFEVAGERPFDFCLVADAAEFKWLRSVQGDGSQTDVAFASSNLSFRAPRHLVVDGLPPGKYRVDMMFGPDGASGAWIAKIAPRAGDKPRTSPLCSQAIELTTAQKMKDVDWPGLISIFHGQNWGEDEKYVTAIKECGFRATGAAEFQLAHCRKQGLRAFVFIWPHEAKTIPPKYRDDKTVLCYYLSDRVQPAKWGLWANLESQVHQAAPRHPAVFTMRGLWGGIDQFCPAVRGRLMEYYHYHWDANRGPHMHFALLEQFRKASAANGDVPICRVVETRPEDMRKTRQTIFTCLAYGVRAFRTGGRGIFDAERDERGVPKRNAFGEEFKRINAALAAYSPIFKKARSVAVYHTAPLPAGCVEAPDDSWFKLAGEEVLVGHFREPKSAGEKAVGDASDYFLVANRDAFAPRTATLTLTTDEARVARMDKISGKWVVVAGEKTAGGLRVSLRLEEGSGELLRVVREQGAAGSR